MDQYDIKTIEIIKNSGKPVLIYGNMQYAIKIRNALTTMGVEVTAFVVDNKYSINVLDIQGTPVRYIDDYLELANEFSLVIGFMNTDSVKHLLSVRKLLKFEIYHFFDVDAFFVWDDDFWNAHEKDFFRIRDVLADSKSKECLDAIIQWRRNGAGDSLIQCADSDQYFNILTYEKETKNEVYIDCGAFNGDSTLGYINFVNGVYKKIYVFEPIHENMQMLKASTRGCSDIEYFEMGTWSHRETLCFSDEASASAVSDTGTQIEVTSIDDTVGDEKVTFIKMDIEGSEFETLKGASNTIRHNMPKIAVCVYHKKDDIYRFIDFLSEFNNEAVHYAFYLRHHSCTAYETVLYAIPEVSR